MASWAPPARRERSLTNACRTQRNHQTAGRTELRVRLYSRERANVGAGLPQAREDFAGTIAWGLQADGTSDEVGGPRAVQDSAAYAEEAAGEPNFREHPSRLKARYRHVCWVHRLLRRGSELAFLEGRFGSQ